MIAKDSLVKLPFLLLEKRVLVSSNQGDQIGQIFAFWAIFISAVFSKLQSGPNFWAILFHGKSNASLLLTLCRLGYTPGDFFSQTHLVTLLPTHVALLIRNQLFGSDGVPWAPALKNWGKTI
jgi:hypothetical protein